MRRRGFVSPCLLAVGLPDNGAPTKLDEPGETILFALPVSGPHA